MAYVVLIMRTFMSGTLPEVWGPFDDPVWAVEVATEAGGHVVVLLPAPVKEHSA